MQIAKNNKLIFLVPPTLSVGTLPTGIFFCYFKFLINSILQYYSWPKSISRSHMGTKTRLEVFL